MSVEKIAAIKAKRLAKKRTTIKVDDDLEAGVLVSRKTVGLKKCVDVNFSQLFLWSLDYYFCLL